MMTRVALILAAVAVAYAADRPKSWTSDNGNGAWSNPTDAETFQWVDLQRSDTLLLSLKTHRHLVARRAPGQSLAIIPAQRPIGKTVGALEWKVVK